MDRYMELFFGRLNNKRNMEAAHAKMYEAEKAGDYEEADKQEELAEIERGQLEIKTKELDAHATKSHLTSKRVRPSTRL